MELLFYTETEAWMGPVLVRTYYFDDDTKATAELWKLDVPEDHPDYEVYKDYAYAWDVFLDVPTENSNVSFRKEIGTIAVHVDCGDGGAEVSDEIVEMIKEYYETQLIDASC